MQWLIILIEIAAAVAIAVLNEQDNQENKK